MRKNFALNNKKSFLNDWNKLEQLASCIYCKFDEISIDNYKKLIFLLCKEKKGAFKSNIIQLNTVDSCIQNLFKNRENWLFSSKRRSIIFLSFYSKFFALRTLAFDCAGVGLEPTHSGSWARQANQLLHPAIDWVRASSIWNQTAWLLFMNQSFLKRKKAYSILKEAIFILFIAIRCKCAASFTSQTSFIILISFQSSLEGGAKQGTLAQLVILLAIWIKRMFFE